MMVVNVIRLFVDMGESSGASLVTQSVQDNAHPKLSEYEHRRVHRLDRQVIKKSKDALTRTPLLRKEGEFIFWVVDREIWKVRVGNANRG